MLIEEQRVRDLDPIYAPANRVVPRSHHVTNLYSQLISLQTFPQEALQTGRGFSPSTTNLTYSISSTHWIIAIYHNSSQDSAHKKDNSRFYSLYIQPPTIQKSFLMDHVIYSVEALLHYWFDALAAWPK